MKEVPPLDPWETMRQTSWTGDRREDRLRADRKCTCEWTALSDRVNSFTMIESPRHAMNREMLINLWQTHRNDEWPHIETGQAGPLMTLDTVISGCVVHVLDGQEELDDQRRAIVSDCLAELDALEVEINDECRSYFSRLRELGTLLLITT